MAERNYIDVTHLVQDVINMELTLVNLLLRASRSGDCGAVVAVERLIMERQRSAEDESEPTGQGSLVRKRL